MKTVIITEGSSTIGFGHITRCLSIYEVFEEHGDEAVCVVNGDAAVSCLVDGRRAYVFDWMKEEKRLFGYLEGSDIVIVDSYMAGREFYEAVSGRCPCPVYIDDMKRIDYPEGVVLNGSVSSEKLGYPELKGSVYLLGAQYAFIRKEFRDAPAKKITPEAGSALVTFGGDDIRQMTVPVVKMLLGHFPRYTVDVIVGRGFKDIAAIERLSGDRVRPTFYPDAARMKRSMAEADIAVSGGGQTLYELARMGVPTVGIGVADNQKVNLQGWEEEGFVSFAGWYDDPDVIAKTALAIEETVPYDVRLKRSEAGRRIMDGKSMERLYRAVVGQRRPAR
jgi:spore coat polysaccharide biosynthesis predicted glycosyltransferase SpsG